MPLMSVDGLVSGLSTSQLISQLMQAEGIPQTQLKTKQRVVDSTVTALQSVNTRVLALKEAAAKVGLDSSWSAMKGTSSSDAVGVTTTAGAHATSQTLHVERLARAHSTASAARYADPKATGAVTGPVTLTQKDKDGVSTTAAVDLGDGSLDALVKGINDASTASGLAVRASTVKTDTGYALQLTSSRSGADGTFTLDGAGTQDVLTAGQDASVRVGGTAGATLGTAGTGGLVVTSPTNTFTGVLQGVTFTANALATDVTVTTVPDDAPALAAVKGLVEAANAALAELSRVSATSANGAGRGALTGSSTVRQLQQSILGAVSGISASGLGIQTTKAGRLTLDEKVLADKLAADPAAVRKAMHVATATDPAVGGYAQRLEAVAVRATDATTGSLTTAISGRQSASRDLTTQIEGWNRRLALREASLKRQFGGLEVALGKLQNQSQWLSGQLAGMVSGS